MNPLIPTLSGALVVLGMIVAVLGIRRSPITPARPNRSRLARRYRKLTTRTKVLLGVGLFAGLVIWLITGWLIAAILAPLAVWGLPILLSSPESTTQIDKLDALEEWARGLAGILTAGAGLEEALRMSLRSTPKAIRPEVTVLVGRLRARVGTVTALRAFADDINDATGDLVAAYLILGAKLRGNGLASVLVSLAESVAEDVSARRRIEADRAKPRTTARWVTAITITVLGLLFMSGDYIGPYSSPLGQALLAALLATYVALLVWLRSMAKGQRLPRFLGDAARKAGGRR